MLLFCSVREEAQQVESKGVCPPWNVLLVLELIFLNILSGGDFFCFFLKQVSSSYGCNDNVCLVRTPKSEGQPDEISTGWDY